MNLFSTLDLGDYVSIAVLLLAILALVLSRRSGGPMSSETRTFLFKFIESNNGVCWAFTVFLVSMRGLFIGARFNLDPMIIDAFKTIMTGSISAMWLMLTIPSKKPTDQPPLVAGTEGTRDTITHEKALPASPVDPSKPLIVEEIVKPVTVKPEDKP